MGSMASQITSLTIVYSAVYSGADQRKHQCSASLAFVRGIHRGPVNSPHKWPVTRKMFPCDDVIMIIVCHRISRKQSGRPTFRRTILKMGIKIFFPLTTHKELLRKEKGWLTDVGHNWWRRVKWSSCST